MYLPGTSLNFLPMMFVRACSLLEDSANNPPSITFQTYAFSFNHSTSHLLFPLRPSEQSYEVHKVFGISAHLRDRWPGFPIQLCHQLDVLVLARLFHLLGPQSLTTVWVSVYDCTGF